MVIATLCSDGSLNSKKHACAQLWEVEELWRAVAGTAAQLLRRCAPA
jgi:hypothetical protein